VAVRYGAYVQLLQAAQADTDPVHRQAAMDQLAIIAPMAGTTGADGSCPGDGPAAAILHRLYPQPHPQARAQVEADALAMATVIVERHKATALAAIRAGAVSAGQGGDQP
jgi:hypothetical protein